MPAALSVIDPDQFRADLLRDLRIMDTAPEPLFDALVASAAHLCQSPIALISLVDTDRTWFKARFGLDDLTEVANQDSMCYHIISSGLGFIEVTDTLEHALTRGNRYVQGAPKIRHYAAVPLRVAGGHMIGTLSVSDTQPRTLTAQQRDRLMGLAQAVGLGLEARQAKLGTPCPVLAHRGEPMLAAQCDGVLVTDDQQRLSYANAGAQQLIAKPMSALMGQVSTTLFDPSQGAKILGAFQCLRDGYPIYLQTALRVSQDQTVDVGIHLVPQMGQGGELLSTLWYLRSGPSVSTTRLAGGEGLDWHPTLYESTGIAHFDESARLLTADDATLAILGEPKDHQAKMPGLAWLEHARDDEKTRILTTWIDAARRKVMINLVFDLHFPSRDPVSVRLTALPNLDAGGRLCSFSSVLEVLARHPPEASAPEHAAELVLASALVDEIASKNLSDKPTQGERQRLSHLLDGTKVGTWEWHIPSGQVQINRYWAEMLGYRVSEISPMTVGTFYNLVHPEDIEKLRSLYLEHATDSSKPYREQHRMLHKEGHWIWVQTNGKILSWDQDKNPEWMYGTQTEITLQKQKDRDLESALKESNNFFELSLDLLCILDASARITKHNDAFAQFFSADEFDLRGESILRFLPDVEQAEFRRTLEVALTSCQIINQVNCFFARDRSLRHIEWRARSDDRLIYLTGRDVTHNMAYQQNLVKQRQAAELATRAKAEFLATMTHEIRTPMNGVLGMLDAVLNQHYPVDLQQEYLRTAWDSARNLLKILDDILDYSALESGSFKIEQSPTPVSRLIHETLLMLRPTAKAKHLELLYYDELPPHTSAMLDPVRIRQVINNLVSNALKFTQTGEVRVRLSEVRIGTHEPKLRVSVEDTGPGIEKSQLDRLFHRYARGESSTGQRISGTGLGLAISKELIGQMDGSLEVESRPGHGSRFWFEIPFIPVLTTEQAYPLPNTKTDGFWLHPALETVSAKLSLEQLQANFNALKILVVEDNRVNQRVVNAILQAADHTCICVDNGQAALTALATEHFDIVLMDIEMPVMDGLTALQHIRATSPNPTVPVIALTANAWPEDRAKAMKAGADGYLTKPVVRQNLLTAIHRVLATHAAQSHH